MNEKKEIPSKVSQYLIHLLDNKDTSAIHDFLIHSKIYIDEEYSPKTYMGTDLLIVVDPETYKTHQSEIEDFKDLISEKIFQFSQNYISHINVLPDLNKFQVLENRIIPINTPWEKINHEQNILLEQLRTASETIGFQNIGNTCRTILQNLSNIVFDSTKHTAQDPKIDLSEGKFKNRLHTYIKCELASDKNKELRELAVSMVNATEDSIDISNKLTHDLNAKSISSEFCAISTITVIGLIKLIAK